MAKNFGSGVVGGVVLVDPATGLPYKATGGGGGGGIGGQRGGFTEISGNVDRNGGVVS